MNTPNTRTTPQLLSGQILCGGINSSILYDCDKPGGGGIEANLLIANYGDIASKTSMIDNSNQLTDITMSIGRQFYEVQGYDKSLQAQYEMVVSDIAPPRYNHIINCTVLRNDILTKKMLDGMSLGKLVAIIEHKSETDSKYEVYGLLNGLKVTEASMDSSSDTAGYHNIVLTSIMPEPKRPATLMPVDVNGDPDFTALLALIEKLSNPEGNPPLNGVLTVLPTNVATDTDYVLTATATIGDGDLAKCVFYNANTNAIVNTDTTAPFSFTTQQATAGVYNYYAVITDSNNLTVRTNTVSVTVTS